MKIPRRRFLHLAASAAMLPAMSRIASALDYPTRPVRMIVPFAPGGPSDVFARLRRRPRRQIGDRLAQIGNGLPIPVSFLHHLLDRLFEVHDAAALTLETRVEIPAVELVHPPIAGVGAALREIVAVDRLGSIGRDKELLAFPN
jgi:hypothetical protein